MDSLRVNDASIKRELWYSIRGGGDSARAERKAPPRTYGKPTVAEQRLLQLLLSDEVLRKAVLAKLEPEEYNGLPTAPIFRALAEGEREGAIIDFDFLSKKTEGDAVAELLPALLMGESSESEDKQSESGELAAQRCVDALRLMNVDVRIRDLTSEIAAAERNGEMELRDRLSTEHLDLARRRSALLPKPEALRTGS